MEIAHFAAFSAISISCLVVIACLVVVPTLYGKMSLLQDDILKDMEEFKASQ